MKGKRNEGVEELIRQELGAKLVLGMKDPRIKFVTVTHVDLSEDLKFAKVFYTVLGNDQKKKEIRVVLEKARGFLQQNLGDALRLRYTPHLTFILDTSLDEAKKIDSIIHKIHEEEQHEA